MGSLGGQWGEFNSGTHSVRGCDRISTGKEFSWLHMGRTEHGKESSTGKTSGGLMGKKIAAGGSDMACLTL